MHRLALGRRVIRRQLVAATNQNASLSQLTEGLIPYNQTGELILSEHEERFVDCIVTLQEEEDRLDTSLAIYLHKLSDTTPREQRKGRKSQKRKGITDNQHNLHKLREKLRHELPELFWPLYNDHDFSIYDESVVLKIFKKEWEKPMTISGLRSYRLACGTSKQKILIEMNSPKMEVMDSSIDMKMGEVQIKWRIVGDSKLNYTLGRILPINSRPNETRMISTFRVNNTGRVIQHIISDMEIIKGHQWNRATSMALIMGVFGTSQGQALPPSPAPTD